MPMRAQSKSKQTAQSAGKRGKTRENAGDLVVIGASFVPDRLREWREFSCQSYCVAKRIKSNPALLLTLNCNN